MDLSKLKTEIATDPLGKNYAGMTIQQVVDSLLTEDRVVNRDSMSGEEISSAIDKAEYRALATDAEKDRVIAVTNSKSVNPFGFVETVLKDIFGSSTTISNLAALRKKTISRAEEIGLSKVKFGWVEAIK